jgi:hypothetical protein
MANLKIGVRASGVGARGRGIFIFSLCPKGMGVCLVPIENRFRYATGCDWWYSRRQKAQGRRQKAEAKEIKGFNN